MNKKIIALPLLIFMASMGFGQGLKLKNRLMISDLTLRQGASREGCQACLKKLAITWNSKIPSIEMAAFIADRGKSKGNYLLAMASEKDIQQAKPSMPEIPCRLVDFVDGTSTYKVYERINRIPETSEPAPEILGMHYIQVKSNLTNEFEKFVTERLNPSVGVLQPDFQIIYYKEITNTGQKNYIAIFALKTPGSRDKYWPGGKDSEILRQLFRPLQGIAKELGTYLVDGSYLEPSSGGAAAYFESKVWTDFVWL